MRSDELISGLSNRLNVFVSAGLSLFLPPQGGVQLEYALVFASRVLCVVSFC